MTTATKATKRKGAGRVAFLARKDEFKRLLDAGHPQRSIYDDHAAELGISYSQFNRYVGKYLGKAHDHEHQRNDTQAAPAAAGSGEQAAGNHGSAARRPATSEQRRPGFQHDPNSGNDRDDLI